jgi:hypothetical protein
MLRTSTIIDHLTLSMNNNREALRASLTGPFVALIAMSAMPDQAPTP